MGCNMIIVQVIKIFCTTIAIVCFKIDEFSLDIMIPLTKTIYYKLFEDESILFTQVLRIQILSLIVDYFS